MALHAIPGGGSLAVRIGSKGFCTASGEAVPVLRDLDIALDEHRFTCLTGPSGCGKTTTLRILLGLDREFDGEIDPRFLDQRIAAVFQEPCLLPWRTVEQNIRVALPDDLQEKDIDPLLAAVGLEDFRSSFPAELSLGMARRAALLRAFAVEPSILFLDEPFVSLDERTADRLRALLMDLWRSDPVTVLMITHNVREAVRLADRIIVLSDRPAHAVKIVDVPEDRDNRTEEVIAAYISRITTDDSGLTARGGADDWRERQAMR